MHKISFFDLDAQYKFLKNEIDGGIQEVLNSSQFIQGPQVALLEKKLEEYVGGTHCISVANGTDALQIALMCIEKHSNAEVIIPAFTYIAVIETILLLGLKPVFADIDEKTFNIDVKSAESLITKDTVAIIPTSLYGQCANFDDLNQLAAKHNICIIEDAAQSFGASQHTIKSCGLSSIACTSFFPTKPLGCYGDGGAIFTKDKALYEVIKSTARHGQLGRYNHVRLGVNSRLDTIQAAILLAKLKVLDEEIVRRNNVATYYTEHLNGGALISLPSIRSENSSAWAQYTIRVNNREFIREALNEAGIPTAVHYPVPLYKQPAYLNYACENPVSDLVSLQVLSIPISAYFKTSDIEYIVESINRALNL